MSFRYKGQSRDKVPHSVSHVVVDAVVWKIPDNAFSGCDSLTLLELPIGLQSIGEYALAYCDSLLKLVVPATVHTILEHAFDNCRSLRKVEIVTSANAPSQLKRFGPEAFRSCHSLLEMNIPEGITVIPTGLFADCRSLSKVGIPSTVEVIDDDAFRECMSLLLVEFGNRLVRIGTGAFYSCTHLMNVKIPSSVKAIDDGAFEACGRLSSVEFGDGLNEIGQAVFSQCPNLVNVTIPKTTKWVGEGSIIGCSELSDFYPTMTSLQKRYNEMGTLELCYKQAHHPEPISVELLKKLLEQGSYAAHSTTDYADKMGMTPFHILAISTRPNVSLFSALLKVLPKTLLHRINVHDHTPMQLLTDNHAFGSAALIELILQVTILEPSKHFRLESWRKSVQSAFERTTNSLDEVSGRARRINQIQRKYLKFERLEATSLLEEAIWKAALSLTTKKRLAKVQKVPKINADSRLAARLTGGAQVIIPNVISFLGK